MVLSVTRLHIRALRFLPSFFVAALRSTFQAQRAAGCLGGMTGNESLKGYWTVTGWETVKAMHAFRNSGPHMRAMRRLLEWCDEASFARWEEDEGRLPDAVEAHRQMSAIGHTSKVAHPSDRHSAGICVGTGLPRFGYRFKRRTP